MKNTKIFYLMAVIFSSTMLSCSTDEGDLDTTKPIIILHSPTDEQSFHPGEEIHLDAEFSDNLALGSYKVEIHYAGDGHSHEKHTDEAEWSYSVSNLIEGNLDYYRHQPIIQIPTLIDDLPVELGHYHLGIYLIDKAGNETQHFIEIEIH